MKFTVGLAVVSVFLYCCSPTFQVFDTKAVNCDEIGGYWVFENDTLKITYEFWADRGVMSFSIYDKLEKPIYIDWKNSSFIYNESKLNYWVEEELATLASYYGGFFYQGPPLKAGQASQTGLSVSSLQKFKPERITFIPPKSYYHRSQFYLVPSTPFEFDYTSSENNSSSRKNEKIYEVMFEKQQSPLKFRNFVAFKFSENADSFFFVDNSFFVSSIKQMKSKLFRGKPISYDGDVVIYKTPFTKGTAFYHEIPPDY